MLELKAVGDRDSCIGEKKIKANRAQNSLNCFKDELEPVWCIEEIAFKCNKSMEWNRKQHWITVEKKEHSE